MNYDFSGVSNDELIMMEAAIKAEKLKRDDAHYNELVATLCNAFNELKKAFPTACLDIDIECGECDYSTSLDLMDYFCDGLKPADFYR